MPRREAFRCFPHISLVLYYLLLIGFASSEFSVVKLAWAIRKLIRLRDANFLTLTRPRNCRYPLLTVKLSPKTSSGLLLLLALLCGCFLGALLCSFLSSGHMVTSGN